MLRVSEKNSADRTHGFETPSRGACSHLFRCCIDHQAFFRLMATGPPPLSPYSRFRSYSPPMSAAACAAIGEKQQQVRRHRDSTSSPRSPVNCGLPYLLALPPNNGGPYDISLAFLSILKLALESANQQFTWYYLDFITRCRNIAATGLPSHFKYDSVSIISSSDPLKRPLRLLLKSKSLLACPRQFPDIYLQ
jgi:hypothetical protein